MTPICPSSSANSLAPEINKEALIAFRDDQDLK
jgi:hypothetical protein